MITYERLKELLHYSPDSGIFTWKLSTARCIKPGDIAGCKSLGYIRIRIDGKIYQAHRLAWLYHYGEWPKYGLDHINRIKDDNRIENLRDVDQYENMRNTGNPSDNTSGIKGISWHKKANKWMARIAVNGKDKHLGLYKSFHNAVCARHVAETCLGWQGCDSSSPAYQWVQENIIKEF